MTTTALRQVDLAKPGPGNWQADRAHYAPDTSRIARDLIEYGMFEGTRAGFDLVGAPLRAVDASFVDGHMYVHRVPLVGADRDLRTPPNPVLWLVTRLHPEFRRRNRQAGKAIDARIWLDEYRRWTHEWEPKLRLFNRSMTAVDVAALTHEQLADHIAELYEHLEWSTALHFRLHVSDLGPIGRLLVRARRWGLEEGEIMAAMSGASPTTSEPARYLEPLRKIVASVEAPPATLDGVRRLGVDAAALLDDYLAEFGHRLATGYDLRNPTLIELPDVVLASLKNSPAGSEESIAERAEEAGRVAALRLREQVPPDDRSDFDELLEDARKLYDLRDANGPLTYEWPAGLLRRAMLEAAGRLVTSNRLQTDQHVFDLTAEELIGLLRGQIIIAAEGVAARHVERVARAGTTGPDWLGEPEEPPPLWVFPGSHAEQMQAIFAVMDLLENDQDTPLVGIGVGDAVLRGRARVVRDAEDALARVEPGDIIVAPFTVPTYNAVLAMAGGVVVEHGGLLCHTAVIAREFDIPAVVGAAGATAEIPDGATIEVDPKTGRVTVL